MLANRKTFAFLLRASGEFELRSLAARLGVGSPGFD
jgi:hypothetical protein